MRFDEAVEVRQGCLLILALAELSDAQRHAVIGRHWRGLSCRELAAERDVSRAAVSHAELSGLATLRRLLDRDQVAA